MRDLLSRRDEEYREKEGEIDDDNRVVDYTVAIVGCGPAGLACWMSLSNMVCDKEDKNTSATSTSSPRTRMKVILIDSGKNFEERNRESPYELTTGNLDDRNMYISLYIIVISRYWYLLFDDMIILYLLLYYS